MWTNPLSSVNRASDSSPYPVCARFLLSKTKSSASLCQLPFEGYNKIFRDWTKTDTENTDPTTVVLYNTRIRPIDQMTYGLMIIYWSMERDKHLIVCVSKEFRQFKIWLTIRIQILPAGPIFSFPQPNAPTTIELQCVRFLHWWISV